MIGVGVIDGGTDVGVAVGGAGVAVSVGGIGVGSGAANRPHASKVNTVKSRQINLKNILLSIVILLS
jgi:hypothetical protein